MATVLITGFEPFDGDTENPSAEVARAFDGRILSQRQGVGVVLPCTFDSALRVLREQLRRHQPELVICVGQAGGRDTISVERVAINIDDARIADNAGAKPIDQPIVRNGPVGYWSSLPIKAIFKALEAAKIPVSISQSAGTFVCNHVFYGLMRSLARSAGRGGFIHIPYTPAQAAKLKELTPSMAIEVAIQGIEIAVKISLRNRHDIKTAGGATH